LIRSSVSSGCTFASYAGATLWKCIHSVSRSEFSRLAISGEASLAIPKIRRWYSGGKGDLLSHIGPAVSLISSSVSSGWTFASYAGATLWKCIHSVSRYEFSRLAISGEASLAIPKIRRWYSGGKGDLLSHIGPAVSLIRSSVSSGCTFAS